MGAYPKKVTNREMLEDDYELKGYSVLQMNLKDGSLAVGTYYLQFFEGPIFVEELDPEKKINAAVKISISPIEFQASGENLPRRNNHKLAKQDYDSYIVERRDEERDLPSQQLKTPETVNTKHRFNNGNKNSLNNANFAEFSRALD